MRIAKTIFKRKNKAGKSTLPNFKIYYKAKIMMIAWYQQRERYLNQRNKLGSPEINLNKHDHLISTYQRCRNNSRKANFQQALLECPDV